MERRTLPLILFFLFFGLQHGFAQMMYEPKSSFGTNGIAHTYAGTTMAIDAAGNILVADSILIAKYHTDGVPYSSDFGYYGIQKPSIGISSIVPLNDGNILVAGFVGNYPNYTFAVARFLWDGSPDKTFSDDGIRVIDFGGGNSYANSVIIQSNGKIIVSGYAYAEGSYDFALVRLNNNGSLDTSFSHSGKALTDFGKDEKANSMKLQNDGKIVLAGATKSSNGGEQIALARYNADGTLDNSFSNDGKQTSAFTDGEYEAKSLEIQSDGKIVVGGAVASQGNHLFLARYNSDGNIDNTFSNDGILVQSAADCHAGMAVAIQPNGKILLGGGFFDGKSENFCLASYNTDGSTDVAFGHDGVAITDVSNGNDCITGLTITNHRLYVLGNRDKGGTIMVCESDDAGNFYPAVNIKDSVTTARNGVGADVEITAAATDIDGSISKVDFYNNNTLIGTSTESPYAFTWTNVPDGEYSITAKATDNNSLSKTSDAIKILITNSSISPTATITSLSTNTALTAPQTINIYLDIKDPNHSIKKVELYNNFFLWATTTEPPYNFTVNDVPGGYYSFTVKVTDNNSIVTVSNAVDIYLYYPKVAPTVRMLYPTNNTTLNAPATIKLSALAEDDNSRVAKVNFYNNDTLVGTSTHNPNATTESPFIITLNNLAAGNYSFTAKAIDKDYLVTASDPVRVFIKNPNGAPFVTLTSPVSNKSFQAPAAITLSAAAGDPDGSVTKVDFYSNDALIGTSTVSPYTFIWKDVPGGTYTITAKVTDDGSMVTTSSSVHIVVYNQKVAPSVNISNQPANDTFTAPASITINATATDADGFINRVDFYSNATLIGTATKSPYAFTWSNVPAGTYSITAKATDNDSLVTTSAPVQIFVDRPKIAPSVSIIIPEANMTFTAPGSITISATAEDTDGSISKVDFYSNGTRIGSATTSPFTFTWNNVPAGNYSITAKAIDNDGLVTASDPVKISVHNSKIAPSVTITNPVVNKTFIAPASITITANAADADGSISKVEFFNDNTLIGTATLSPYSFTWNNIPAGNYFITAKATDNDGLVTNSVSVRISVVPNKAPIVRIVNPLNAQRFTAPASIPFIASAEDADGKISKVEFYNGNTLLKTVTDAPYNYTWENVRSGSYSISAVATDDYGLRTTSQLIMVTVNPKNSVIVKYAPNPATNILNISTLGFEQNKTLSISVIASGVVLRTTELDNTGQIVQLDVSSLVSGIYTIKLTCGNKVISKQFLKL